MFSIVIPSHNEKNLPEMVNTCQELFPEARIIVGDDKDGKGKGYATKKGFEYDKRFLPRLKDYIIVFIDGDGDIEPRMIFRLLPFLEDYDIVLGTKSIWEMPFKRKILTILSRIYIKIMFGLNFDTQTGIKAFRESAIPEWNTKGFDFDIEFLAKAKRNGMRFMEVPIIAKVSKGKSMEVIWRTFVSSLKVWLALSFPHGKTKT